MSVPKFQLVKAILEERLGREFSAGSRLPSEVDLCRSFRVSRSTIQQALGVLEKDGVVTREQGRGTFYVGETTRPVPARLSGLLESVMKDRGNTFARLIHKGVVPASARIAERLGIPPSSPVVTIVRVAGEDEVPIMLIRSVLPYDLGHEFLTTEVLREKKPIASLLKECYGIKFATVQQTIGAALADPEVSTHLGVEMGAPVLEVDRTFFDATGRVLNFSTSFYRTDRYRFQVTLKEWP